MAKCVKVFHWSWVVAAMAVIVVTCGSAAVPMPAPVLVDTPKSSAAADGLTGTPRPTAMERSQPVPIPASVQRYGGNLRMSASDGIYDWDPKYPFHFSSIQVVSQLYNQIVQYDTKDSGKVICDLCERWEMSNEGRTFTFHIRPGIKWLDGQDLTADDVHHSMLRYGDLSSSDGLSGRWRDYTLVAKDGGVNYIDSSSVEFNLPKFSGAFIKSLALDYVKVLPKHLLERDIDLNLPENIMQHRSGSGPFVLESYREGQRYKVSKNQDYFKEGRPYLDSIDHFVINETSTLIASLLTDNIDMSSGFHRLPPTSASSLEVESGGEIRAVAMRYGDNGLLLNVKKEPFGDPRVRKAIALAIDYQDWNQQIFDNNSRVGCPLLGLAHSSEECEAWPGIRSKDTPDGRADLGEAKRLMAEAGYPDGFTSKYDVREFSTYSDQCEVLQSQLKNALSIDGRIQVHRANDYLNHLNTSRPVGQEGDWDMACQGHSGVPADVDNIMSLIYQKGGVLNFTDWENDHVNALFRQQRVETDPARRREINKQLELFLVDQGDNPWISLGRNVRFWMINEQVQGFHAPQTRYSHFKHEDLWLGSVVAVEVARNTASPVRINSPVPVIATFTKSVTGFTVDEVIVANGVVSNFVADAGGMVYAFDVTPNAIGQVTVNIAANVAMDTDGNGNAAAQLQLGIPYDDNGNGTIERSEVIRAINDYLGGGSMQRSHVITLINLYLSGRSVS